MSSTCVFAHVARVCLYFVTNITLFPHARTDQVRRLFEAIFARSFKLGNLQPFLIGLILGKFDNVSGKKLFLIGKIRNFVVKF